MKKKIVSCFSSILLVMTLLVSTCVGAEASDRTPMLDGSYLTREEESIGTATAITRGEDLQTGYSKLVRLGPGVIYAGGTTIADHTVDSVKVSVMVERTLGEDDEWHYVTEWRVENLNADSANTSRRLEVDGGYYYRVRCTHSAGNDMSSSFTDGIFIESP